MKYDIIKIRVYRSADSFYAAETFNNRLRGMPRSVAIGNTNKPLREEADDEDRVCRR